MKIKRLFLSIPVIAVLAGCSAKITVFRDIFKDARSFTDEKKAEVIAALEATQDGNGNKCYTYTGTRNVRTYLHGELIANIEDQNIQVVFSNDIENSNKYAVYKVGNEVKWNPSYNNESSSWEGLVPDGYSQETLFNRFESMRYSWNGHILAGNFDVLPYEYNTKLLNCVSAKFSKDKVKNVVTGNFAFNLRTQASYSDGDVKYIVNSYATTYSEHRIESYSINYSINIEDADIRVELSISGTFDYTYLV